MNSSWVGVAAGHARTGRQRGAAVPEMAFLVVAAYLLISHLAQIGIRVIADELRDAEPVWVVVA